MAAPATFAPSTGVVQLLFAQHEAAEIWDAETTATEADQFPGEAVAGDSNKGLLVWQPRGAYDGTIADIHLEVSEGGYPDGRAAYVFSFDETTWYGWDQFTTVTHLESVAWTNSATVAYGQVTVAEAADGTLVMVTAGGTGNPNPDLRLWKRSPGATSWTNVGAITAPTFSDYSVDYGAFPQLVRLDDGTLQLMVQHHVPLGVGVTASAAVQVAIYRAPADAAWTSDPFVLEVPQALEGFGIVQPAGTPEPKHLAAAAGGGQVVLFVTATNVTADLLHQWASSDGGASFSSINSDMQDVRSPAVVRFQRWFLVAYYDTSGATVHLKVRRLTSALNDFEDAPEIEVSTETGHDDETPPVLVATETEVWLYYTRSTKLYARVSRDAGATWSEEIKALGRVSQAGAGTSAIAAAYWRGRVVMLVRPNVSGWDKSLGHLEFGGWTNRSMPLDRSFVGDRLAWTQTWTCFGDRPIANDVWTETTTGAVAVAFDDTSMHVTTDAGEDYELVHLPDAAVFPRQVYGGKFVMNFISGVGRIVVCGESYGIAVDYDGVGISITDLGAGFLHTQALTGWHELVLFVDATNGVAHGYLRTTPASSDAREYTVLFEDQILASLGPLTPTISWFVDESSEARLRIGGWLESGPQQVISADPTYGRPVSAIPQFTTRGVRLGATLGPAVKGDTYVIAPASLTGVDKHAATADHPSPRSYWEASGTGDANIAYQIATTGGARPRSSWGVWVQTNARRVYIDFYKPSVGWFGSVLVKAELEITATCGGVWVVPDAAGSATSAPRRFVAEDELVDGYVVLDGVAVKILGNTAGLLEGPYTAGGENWRTAAIRVEDGHDGEVATEVWFPRSMAHIGSGDMPPTFNAFRIQYESDNGTGAIVPPEGRIRGKAIAGPAYWLVKPHGKDSGRQLEPVYEDASAAGMRVRRRVSEPIEILELSWQDSPDIFVGDVLGTDGARYVVDDDGVPIASRGETASTMRALVRRWAPTGVPVAYHPGHTIASGTERWDRMHLFGGFVGTIEGPWRTDHAGHGEEIVNPVTRLGRLRLRSIP
jgi:hypothetical protein